MSESIELNSYIALSIPGENPHRLFQIEHDIYRIRIFAITGNKVPVTFRLFNAWIQVAFDFAPVVVKPRVSSFPVFGKSFAISTYVQPQASSNIFLHAAVDSRVDFKTWFVKVDATIVCPGDQFGADYTSEIGSEAFILILNFVLKNDRQRLEWVEFLFAFCIHDCKAWRNFVTLRQRILIVCFGLNREVAWKHSTSTADSWMF